MMIGVHIWAAIRAKKTTTQHRRIYAQTKDKTDNQRTNYLIKRRRALIKSQNRQSKDKLSNQKTEGANQKTKQTIKGQTI